MHVTSIQYMPHLAAFNPELIHMNQSTSKLMTRNTCWHSCSNQQKNAVVYEIFPSLQFCCIHAKNEVYDDSDHWDYIVLCSHTIHWPHHISQILTDFCYKYQQQESIIYCLFSIGCAAPSVHNHTSIRQLHNRCSRESPSKKCCSQKPQWLKNSFVKWKTSQTR